MKSALQATQEVLSRDVWLAEFIRLARPKFAAAGKPIPQNVRAAICPPHRNKMRYVGLCWSDQATEDSGREIWVSSAYTDPVRVAGILVHELCHAALPHSVKHGKPFKVLATKLGLEGPMRATTEGAVFRALWKGILAELGPLPAARFMAAPGVADVRVQVTPKAKNVSCPKCGFTAKVQVRQLSWGRLTCPVHEGVKLLAKGERGWVFR